MSFIIFDLGLPPKRRGNPSVLNRLQTQRAFWPPRHLLSRIESITSRLHRNGRGCTAVGPDSEQARPRRCPSAQISARFPFWAYPCRNSSRPYTITTTRATRLSATGSVQSWAGSLGSWAAPHRTFAAVRPYQARKPRDPETPRRSAMTSRRSASRDSAK